MGGKLNSRYVDLEYCDNIVKARYAEELEVNIAVAIELIQLRKEVSQNENCLLFIDARNIKSISKEARSYVSSKEGQQNLKATAILTTSNFVKLLSNFLIRIDLKKESSTMPIKLFTTEKDAIAWLKQYE